MSASCQIFTILSSPAAKNHLPAGSKASALIGAVWSDSGSFTKVLLLHSMQSVAKFWTGATWHVGIIPSSKKAQGK